MRCVRCFLVILLLLLVVNGEEEVLAMNTGFSTEILPDEAKNTFLTNVNISMLANEPPKRAIECFDVNEKLETYST